MANDLIPVVGNSFVLPLPSTQPESEPAVTVVAKRRKASPNKRTPRSPTKAVRKPAARKPKKATELGAADVALKLAPCARHEPDRPSPVRDRLLACSLIAAVLVASFVYGSTRLQEEQHGPSFHEQVRAAVRELADINN